RKRVIWLRAVESQVDRHPRGEQRAAQLVGSPCQPHVELRLLALGLGDSLRIAERVPEDRFQSSGPCARHGRAATEEKECLAGIDGGGDSNAGCRRESPPDPTPLGAAEPTRPSDLAQGLAKGP